MIKTINNQTTKKEKKMRIKTLKYKKAIVVQRENFLKADEKKIIWRSICSFVLYLNETVAEHCVPNVSVIGILLRNIMILKKCFVFRYIKKEKEKKIDSRHLFFWLPMRSVSICPSTIRNSFQFFSRRETCVRCRLNAMQVSLSILPATFLFMILKFVNMKKCKLFRW